MDITPRNYKKMQMTIKPQNKIDTIHLEPILNNTTPVSKTVDVDLSTDDNTPATYIRTVYTEGADPYFKSRVDILMYEGTQNITMDTPLATNAEINIDLQLRGHSVEIEREELSYDDMPDMDALNDFTQKIAPYITTHKTKENDTLLWEYGTNNFRTNPILKSAAATGRLIKGEYIIPIKNTWIGQDRWPVNIFTSEKQNYALSTDIKTETIEDISSEGFFGGVITTLDYVSITATVVRIDDTHLQVNYQIPVRFSYLAASADYVLLSHHDIASWAFNDYIDQVSITVSTYSLDTTSKKISYSLTEQEELTENIKNMYNYTINAEELLTLDTYSPDEDLITVHLGPVIERRVSSVDMYMTVVTPNKNIKGSQIVHSSLVPANQDTANIVSYDVSTQKYVISCTAYKYFDQNVGNDVLVGANTEYYKNISKILLSKFQHGKFIIILDVYAEYALTNDIHINSVCRVKKQNNEYITRNGSICNFVVKNIIKKFESSEFLYTLSLMEE